jgi:hypothetical protein
LKDHPDDTDVCQYIRSLVIYQVLPVAAVMR